MSNDGPTNEVIDNITDGLMNDNQREAQQSVSDASNSFN